MGLHALSSKTSETDPGIQLPRGRYSAEQVEFYGKARR